MEELQDPQSSIYPCLFGPGALTGEEKRNKLTGEDDDDHIDGGVGEDDDDHDELVIQWCSSIILYGPRMMTNGWLGLKNSGEMMNI